MNKNPIDMRLKEINSNAFILGTPGSGRHVVAKKEILNILLDTDDEVIVIDMDGEWEPFTRALGDLAEHIEVLPISLNYINPMDMDKEYSLCDKVDFIISLCEEALSLNGMGITPVQLSFIDECVRKTYTEYIAHDFDKDYQPTFKELQDTFNKNAKLPDHVEVSEAFKLYSTGSLSVFANKTNVDIKRRFVVYDIHDLVKSLSTIGQLIVLDHVRNHIQKNKKNGVRAWLYIDDFTSLLRKESSKNFLHDTCRLLRPLGSSFTLITNDVNSVLHNDIACEMLANAQFIYLLNQLPENKGRLATVFNMSEKELEYVSDKDKGCGVIITQQDIVPFEIMVSKQEEKYIFA